MVSWDERTVTDDSEGGGVVNNYYDEEDSGLETSALVLTAVFCFLGGILIQTAVQFFWFKKNPPLAESNNVEMSSSKA
jgi:hypothetical protein